mmetsp:Transcript_13741/g.37167  ORF Transcript_13741/g.37167 Transcript_13741/m.37167 type:complete len:227 (-) Transcript_13741:256-936(-)
MRPVWVHRVAIMPEIMAHQHFSAPLPLQAVQCTRRVQGLIWQLVNVEALPEAPILHRRSRCCSRITTRWKRERLWVIDHPFCQVSARQRRIGPQALHVEYLGIDVSDVRIPLHHQLLHLCSLLVTLWPRGQNFVAQLIDLKQERLRRSGALFRLHGQNAVHHHLQHHCRAALQALLEERLYARAEDLVQEVLGQAQVVPAVSLLPPTERLQVLWGEFTEAAGAQQR